LAKSADRAIGAVVLAQRGMRTTPLRFRCPRQQRRASRAKQHAASEERALSPQLERCHPNHPFTETRIGQQ